MGGSSSSPAVEKTQVKTDYNANAVPAECPMHKDKQAAHVAQKV